MQFEIPRVAKQKRSMARSLRRRAQELDIEADELIENKVRSIIRESKDKQLNRTQTLELLPISTLESLKSWERKYRPYGYLRFRDNKIMRSEVLRFTDDKQSGKIHRMMNGH